MPYYSANSNRFNSHDQPALLLCKMPSNNFNFDYSDVLTIRIAFYFRKLYFSLLRTQNNLENQSSNFVPIFCHMPHNSERKYAVL